MSITHATHLHTRLCWRTSALPCIPILHCVLPPPYRHDVAVLLQASLAAGMVDAVLIPEVAFTLEGEGGLLAYLEKIMEEKVGGAGRGGACGSLLNCGCCAVLADCMCSSVCQ